MRNDTSTHRYFLFVLLSLTALRRVRFVASFRNGGINVSFPSAKHVGARRTSLTTGPEIADPLRRWRSSSPSSLASSGEAESPIGSEDKEGDDSVPAPLQPYVPALDPSFPVRFPIGESSFVIARAGPPLAPELANENILKIVQLDCTDLEVNTLVWKCLGYRFDGDAEKWVPEEVFPKWKERFPDPPDLIGMTRIYSREVDQASLRSNQALVRSVPVDNKQSLKVALKPLGWKGYQYKELTPNKTRRAQCANWLVFYREELFGYTVEELREKRILKKEKEAKEDRERLEAKAKAEAEGRDVEEYDDWKPPVTEVF